MKIGVPKETFPGEKRVAIIPDVISLLIKREIEVIVEAGAGKNAGFLDAAYEKKGAQIASSRKEVFDQADIIAQVRGLGSNPDEGKKDLELMRSGQSVIGIMEPLTEINSVEELAKKGVMAFSMELMPRITRAQSMDILSSMATIAGYKAVLLAAAALPKMFPMMMTAAGTISPAHVFIIGAGVAGLQAIASAKRLGAIVHAYDLRPVVKEQVESLGGKFVELELEAGESEDSGGYAKEMDEDFYKKQREMMIKVVAENDVVITTAAIPGKKAPILVTEEMVKGMRPGSVIVDLAAERGGNCELTKPGETVEYNDVLIIGPENIPSDIPYHASQMYSKNITTFILHLVKEGKMELDMEDEINADTLLTKDGSIIHPRVKEIMNSSAN
ncbi:MAG: Re/Si-specific NAD(P)(+) transhydrogenase subunit alpha [bacterium]|nr:Re/Si-specific NAD(P)(+) transhydrogenase subunit alpha [bacterium]